MSEALMGPPRIAARAWVHASAVVVGDVVLQDDVSVWPTAVIRGDRDRITIGEASNVQDGAVLHADPGVPSTTARVPTSGADPSLVVERAAVFVAAWGAVSFLTVATVSVFARRGVAGLVIVWMVSPAVLAVAGPALGISKAWLETLAFLAPPFHATARLHDVWSGARSDLTERVLIHLLTFPILCLGLIRLGLQRVVTAPAEAE